MSEQIKTTYKGVEITYNENADMWGCDHNNRSYGHEALLKVKERIDAWLKAENTFTRVAAFRITLSSYSRQRFGNLVTVTSRTEEGDLWVMDDGERSKINKKYIDSSIVAGTTENRARVNIVLSKREEIAQLEKQIAQVIGNMDRIRFTEVTE